MGAAQGLYRLYKFKRAMDKVAIAKENARREKLGLPPLMPWYEECFVYCTSWAGETIFQAFCGCCIYDRYRHMRRPEGRTCLGRLCLDGTYENQVFKNIVGFLTGLMMGYLLYGLLVWQLLVPAMNSMLICALIGVLLSLGLAFHKMTRCIFLLMIPQFFSGQGRALLLAYGFMLVMAGPMQNFHHNVHVAAQSVTCGQEMTTNATRVLAAMATAPVKEILDRVRSVLRALVHLAEKLREAFQRVRKLFADVLGAIQRVFSWLGNIVDVCNENMGAPYRKCLRAFRLGEKDCRKKLGVLSIACNIVNVAAPLCQIARVGELLCKITESIKNFIVNTVKLNLKMALKRVTDMFYFNISMEYHYNLTMEQSKTFAQVRKDISDEIERRLSPFYKAVSWANFAAAFMLLWLVIKAMMYRRKYLTRDRFDNYYITFAFRDVNERREEMEKEQALPLNFAERNKYIKPLSLRMVRAEKIKLVAGLVMFGATLLHAGFYLALDYGLFWLLSMIRFHGELKTSSGVPSHLKMHVEGEGVLADMYRSLITSFDPVERMDMNVDTTPCLPNPSQPNLITYRRIGVTFGIVLVLQLLEAYGMRLRHMVAGCYHPDRERERAVWLYNHVLQRRGGFLKFLRRQLRRKYEKDQAVEKISLVSRLGATFPCCSKVFKMLGYERKYCLCCGTPGKMDDYDGFVHCDNYECKAVYCQDCFTDINNLCTVCMKPVDYGDFSDFSEERDSSEDESAEKKAGKSKHHDEESLLNSDSDSSSLDYSYQNKDKTAADYSDDDSSDSDTDRRQRTTMQLSVTNANGQTGTVSVTPRPIERVTMDIFGETYEEPMRSPEELAYGYEGVLYSPEGVPYSPEDVPYAPGDIPYSPEDLHYSPEYVPYSPEDVPYGQGDVPYSPDYEAELGEDAQQHYEDAFYHDDAHYHDNALYGEEDYYGDEEYDYGYDYGYEYDPLYYEENVNLHPVQSQRIRRT